MKPFVSSISVPTSGPSSRLVQGIELFLLFRSAPFVAEENLTTDFFEQEKDRLPSLHVVVLHVALALLLLGLDIGLVVPTAAPLLAARCRIAAVDQLVVRVPLCRRYLFVYPYVVVHLLTIQIDADSDQSLSFDAVPAAVHGSLSYFDFP